MNLEQSEYLKEAVRQLRGLKKVADKALAQTEPADFFATLDAESNSIALLVKHLAGNMRSRWTDFLTSDGEKEDRRRDSEFVLEPGDTREALEHRWNEGWSLLFSAVEPLAAEDLLRTATIRGESLSVLRAIHLQVAHYAYHVGQLVLLAKHFAGSRWQSLSIPRGKCPQASVLTAARADPSERRLNYCPRDYRPRDNRGGVGQNREQL